METPDTDVKFPAAEPQAKPAQRWFPDAPVFTYTPEGMPRRMKANVMRDDPDGAGIDDCIKMDLGADARARLQTLIDSGKVSIEDLVDVVAEYGTTSTQADYPGVLSMIAVGHARAHDTVISMLEDYDYYAAGPSYNEFVRYGNRLNALLAAVAGAYSLGLGSRRDPQALDKRIQTWVAARLLNSVTEPMSVHVDAFLKAGSCLKLVYKGTDPMDGDPLGAVFALVNRGEAGDVQLDATELIAHLQGMRDEGSHADPSGPEGVQGAPSCTCGADDKPTGPCTCCHGCTCPTHDKPD